jgi:hypothetical protein
MDNIAAYKRDVEQRIVVVISKNLDDGIIGYSDFKEITQFTIKGMSQVSDYSTLVSFLKDLSWNWNMFGEIYQQELLKHKNTAQTEAVAKVADMIEQGNLNEALDTAKKAME